MMRSKSRAGSGSAWLLGLMVVLGGARLGWSQSDQIVGVKGTPTNGAVASMTADEVVLTVGSSERKFAITEIKRLNFGDEPPELRRAREQVAGGQLEAALEEIRKIDPSRLARDVVRHDFDFYKAFCEGKLALAGGGDKAAAVTQLRAFMAATKGANYHAYDAAELLGDLAVAMESYENAAKFYAFLSRAAVPELQLRSAVLEGRALFAQQKIAEAQQKFESVIGQSVDDPASTRQKLFATLGKSTCLAASGQPDAGVALVEEILQKNDEKDVPLFARAYNALGVCHLKANRPKAALLAFLHVHLLFFGDGDAHAESLYYLTKLWTDLNKSDESVKMRGILTSRYAGSVWAKKS